MPSPGHSAESLVSHILGILLVAAWTKALIEKSKNYHSHILILHCALPLAQRRIRIRNPLDVVGFGCGVDQWLGSQVLGGVDIINIEIYQFSQTLFKPRCQGKSTPDKGIGSGDGE